MSDPTHSPYEPYPGGPYGAGESPSGQYAPTNGPHPSYEGPRGPWAVPVRMPGTVRTAQIVAWVAGGIGVAAIVAITAVTGDPELMGATMAGFGIQLALAGCAFGFGRGGTGLRTTVITLSCLQALCGLGSVASMQPPGLLGSVVGVVIFCLMIGQPARLWFSRPQP